MYGWASAHSTHFDIEYFSTTQCATFEDKHRMACENAENDKAMGGDSFDNGQKIAITGDSVSINGML
jgi:hypothetical protein